MANITKTEASAFIPQIWAASALGYLKANTVMMNLVNREFSNVFARGGDTLNIPVRGSLVVNTKTANTAVSLQTPSATSVQVTMVHKEVSMLVEDIVTAQANQDVMAGYIQDAMAKIGEQVDSDLLGLYSGFTITPIDATTSFDVTAITAARKALNVVKAPLQDRQIVWGPDAEARILNLQQFTNSQWDPNNQTALERATLGPRYGFMHYMSQLVPSVTGESKNLAFHKNAMVLITANLPDIPAGRGVESTTMVEDGIAIRVQYGYNMTYLGTQVTLDILYGVAKLRNNHAVVIRTTDS